MGYIRHQASIAILSDWDTDVISAIKALKAEMASDESVPDCILGPAAVINGYMTFFFAPDGSKEGWRPSDLCDQYRERFVALAQSSKYPDIVTLQMGGDDNITRVLFTTDAEGGMF